MRKENLVEEMLQDQFAIQPFPQQVHRFEKFCLTSHIQVEIQQELQALVQAGSQWASLVQKKLRMMT